MQVDATENEPKSFIFMSEDALTNPDKLLVLIHGNGVVRAGQWARRLIINEDLDSGTQIPYIKKATEVSESVYMYISVCIGMCTNVRRTMNLKCCSILVCILHFPL